MENSKIDKVKIEIEKTKIRILGYQARLRDLEKQKTRLENEQIVTIVRCEKISDSELSALMASFRGHKSEDTVSETTIVSSNRTEKDEEFYTGKEEPYDVGINEK